MVQLPVLVQRSDAFVPLVQSPVVRIDPVWHSNTITSTAIILCQQKQQHQSSHIEDEGEIYKATCSNRLFLPLLKSRRTACQQLALPAVLVASSMTKPHSAVAAAQRAVGSGEIKCQMEGNCLQVGELDGAIGWGWGGKDRCDASDPMCGPNGQMRSSPITGKPVPALPTPDTIFSHVAVIQISIGRDEISTIKVGLYGNECPGSVAEIVDFLSSTGLTTIDNQSQGNLIGSLSIPVSLSRGGVVSSIIPGVSIEFGVPIQSLAYARSLGMSKLGNTYVPQPRPKPTITENDVFVRRHDCAGLLSVPANGVGYGGTGFESDDEAFESAFLITNDSIPSFDIQGKQLQKSKNLRRVIGQVLDTSSMAFLERLSNLPTKRGIRGVIPGQTSGAPLVKTVVRDVQVAKVTQPASI